MKNITTKNETVTEIKGKFDHLTSNKAVRLIRRLPCPNRHYVTTKATRLDMISVLLYGTYEYDWVLSLVNGLKSVEVPIGKVIKYPNNVELTNFLSEN